MKQKQLNKPPPKIKSLKIRLIHQSQIVLKYILLCFSRLFKMNKERCKSIVQW